ncbi:MAG TPA: C1 family peptidase [Candidatus Limnocylindrales bacterium]|nr:C1 family peptidase [Candidatus Limnocylindrales bacterium]
MNLQLHGFGAIASPPDDRDFQITTLLEADGLLASDGMAAALPSRYVAPHLPPVLDQGLSPTCVAFSSSTMKAWHDQIDQGQFFNFAEQLFFRQIGGTSEGAVGRYALDRMLHYGYPVMNLGQESLHKIDAYFAVAKDIAVIKQALAAYGPLLMLGPWYQSWSSPPLSAVLPAPSGMANGHQTVIEGWDDSRWAFYCQNSWGTNWAASGRFWMPYSYAVNMMWEFWKAIDQKVRPLPLPDTSVKERDMYEWIPKMTHQRAKLAIVEAGTVLLKNPDGTRHFKLAEDTKVEVIGSLATGKQFWAARRPEGSGLFLVPDAGVKRWI